MEGWLFGCSAGHGHEIVSHELLKQLSLFGGHGKRFVVVLCPNTRVISIRPVRVRSSAQESGPVKSSPVVQNRVNVVVLGGEIGVLICG